MEAGKAIRQHTRLISTSKLMADITNQPQNPEAQNSIRCFLLLSEKAVTVLPGGAGGKELACQCKETWV